LDEEEQTYENTWDEQSFEDYYSSQESEEVNTDSEEEVVNDEGDDNPDIYVTRSGRKYKTPERLYYVVQLCLLSLNDHEDQESWSEQLCCIQSIY
jgi:CRISPR/Cas system CSM-associated protein Csm2 small subunit